MATSISHPLSFFEDTMEMPMLFLGHGNPMYAIEKNEFTDTFHSLGNKLPTPKAIVCISAHWETLGTKVTSMSQPRTIHDFGGFPPKLYEVEYPANGHPELANSIKDILMPNTVGLDTTWGLDHGTWSVLKHLYPDAQIPVVQMSLDYSKSAKSHYEFAEELLTLRKKGVLIVGSGNMVHNLAMIDWQEMNTIGYGYDWAIEAQIMMNKFILNRDYHQLIAFGNHGRSMKLSIPTPEHFLPLLYILALTKESDSVALFNDKAVGGSLSMTSVAVGL